MTIKVLAYKGFDKNWQCRNYQYEIGKTYRHDGEVEICNSGFHACQYPLDVFGYYEPSNSRFAEVELLEPVIQREGDTKIASATITIKAELTIPDIVKRAVDWIMDRVDSTIAEGEDQSAASNTGYQSAASNTGYQSAASNTGDQSAASNTGDRSAASNTGHQSAASNTGDRSAASNTGDRSAASVEGKSSVAIATGRESKAKALETGAIVLCNYDDDGDLRHIRASKVGDNGIKPGAWYTLSDDGEFIEAE